MDNKFLNYLKETHNFTETENGAGAYKSTNNACLDAFGRLGAMRKSNEEDIIDVFSRAFAEDKTVALRILFYMRDVRGGQGTRRVFRVIFKWLARKYPEFVEGNLDNVLYFGRGDDLLCLLDTGCRKAVTHFIKQQLKEDMDAIGADKPCSLLAKWLPSENASSKESKRYARMIANDLKWTPRQYRKLLTFIRHYLDICETHMSKKDWAGINYSIVPSKAAMKYSNAFVRNDSQRYTDYLVDVNSGKAKVNAGALYPVDIVQKVWDNGYKSKLSDRILLDAMWNSLPNYCGDENAICMIDTSGSMSGLPLMVSLSLGLYCADKCTGPFHGHFITFDIKPEIQTVYGDNIIDKVRNIRQINPWNTDFEAALQLILDTAVNHNCAQEELPQKLYVISDMQFDEARGANGSRYYDWNKHCYVYPTKEPFMQK